MNNLILVGYEFLTVMLPAIALMVMFHLIYRKQNVVRNRWHAVYMIIFSTYLFCVFHCAGVGTIFDAKRYGIELNMNQINLIPFSDTNIDFVAYGLNIIFFIPFGFLLPLIWSDFHKYIQIFILGISLSALIEISQLLNNRRTDVDDLILNTIGAISGMMLFKLILLITKRKPSLTNSCKYEMAVYVSVTFLCRFFTYDEFGMAKKLFGF